MIPSSRARASQFNTSEIAGSQHPVIHFRGGEVQSLQDILAIEEPLEIRLQHGRNGGRQTRSLSVTMRTPGDDFELAAGFLAAQGVIRERADLIAIDWVVGQSSRVKAAGRRSVLRIDDGKSYRNTLEVRLHPNVVVNSARLERNFDTTSICGVCGKASILALRTVCPALMPDSFEIDSRSLCELPTKARSRQSQFEMTGGMHVSALFDSLGELLSIREDVGRHNAVDKLVGAELLAGRVPLRDRLLFLSGRASFELLQKALMAGIPMVVSVGAPSSMAVEVAREFGITLVGFVQNDRFHIYNRPGRIRFTNAHARGLCEEEKLRGT